MLNLILKIALAVILVAVSIMLFIHVLPWILGGLAIVALVKGIHNWLNGHDNFKASSWWPWGRKDEGGQPTA